MHINTKILKLTALISSTEGDPCSQVRLSWENVGFYSMIDPREIPTDCRSINAVAVLQMHSQNNLGTST